ncbi:hypothetical protein, partial [Pararcticibacter amylolyticus]
IGKLYYDAQGKPTTIAGISGFAVTIFVGNSKKNNVGASSGESGNLELANNSFDIDRSVDYLNDHAFPKYDRKTCGHCAFAVRMALEAGGINTSNHPGSARQYAPYLIRWGFSTTSADGYSAKKGDIRVFQPYPNGSPHGHIDMFNGNQWISDFKENGNWPGYGYERWKPSYEIFRWATP